MKRKMYKLLVACSVMMLTMIGCGNNSDNVNDEFDDVAMEEISEAMEEIQQEAANAGENVSTDESTQATNDDENETVIYGEDYDSSLSQDEQEKVGDKLYNEYCLVFFESINDESWNRFFIPFNMCMYDFADIYKVIITSKELEEDELREEFVSMSDEERQLWMSTYLCIANQIYRGNAEYTASYKDMTGVPTFATHVFTADEYSNSLNKDELIEKYEKLMHWQFDYMTQFGGPYCFQTQHSYLEELTGEF